MKWISGETRESYIARKEQWHKWFAWYPVAIGWRKIAGKKRKVRVWLQHVQRIGTYAEDTEGAYWSWEYLDES